MKTRYTTVNGQIIAEKRNGVRKMYVPDPLGSTVALVDDTQAQADTFQYWPYGEVATRTGTTETPFQYVGTLGYYNDGVSRNYVRARYIDVQVGKWMTEDPIRYRGGEYNLYLYAKSNPETMSDFMGLKPCPTYPRLACFACRYDRMCRSGHCGSDVCKAVAKSCTVFDYEVDCDNPPIVPCKGQPPTPPAPPDNPVPGSPFFDCWTWCCDTEFGGKGCIKRTPKSLACAGACAIYSANGCEAFRKYCQRLCISRPYDDAECDACWEAYLSFEPCSNAKE